MSRRRLTVYTIILIASVAPAAPLCHMPGLAHALDAWCCYAAEGAIKHAESVPQTSATILGLANFGFLLGVRLNRSRIRIQLRYVRLAVAAIAAVTVLQASLIVYAQVWEVYAPFYAYAMAATGAALIVVGVCFVMTVEARYRLGDMEARNSDDVERHTADLQDSNAAGADGV